MLLFDRTLFTYAFCIVKTRERKQCHVIDCVMCNNLKFGIDGPLERRRSSEDNTSSFHLEIVTVSLSAVSVSFPQFFKGEILRYSLILKQSQPFYMLFFFFFF